MLFAVLVSIIGMTGCVTLTESPLYTQRDVVSDLPIEGKWVDADPSAPAWEFTKDGDAYHVVDSREGSPSLEAHLLRLAQWHFLDVVLPMRDPRQTTGHLFVKVWVRDDQLHLAVVSSDWFTSEARESGWELIKPPHNPDNDLLVKAPTTLLQRLVLGHADDPRAFHEIQVLHRPPHAVPTPR